MIALLIALVVGFAVWIVLGAVEVADPYGVAVGHWADALFWDAAAAALLLAALGVDSRRGDRR